MARSSGRLLIVSRLRAPATPASEASAQTRHLNGDPAMLDALAVEVGCPETLSCLDEQLMQVISASQACRFALRFSELSANVLTTWCSIPAHHVAPRRVRMCQLHMHKSVISAGPWGEGTSVVSSYQPVAWGLALLQPFHAQVVSEAITFSVPTADDMPAAPAPLREDAPGCEPACHPCHVLALCLLVSCGCQHAQASV